MGFGDSDLGVFFADFGDTVTFSGKTAKGNLDSPSEMFTHDGPGGIEEDRYMLLLPSNAFTPFPLPQQALAVNGKNFTVRDRQFMDDGALAQLTLKVT